MQSLRTSEVDVKCPTRNKVTDKSLQITFSHFVFGMRVDRTTTVTILLLESWLHRTKASYRNVLPK
jgi:hypothetical protein